MTEEIATREAYGEALALAGEKDNDVVVLDADLSKSTKSVSFQKKFPDRFFNIGIAEQDMIGTAAGLAASGKKVFASTFAVFAVGRTFDQIRNSIAYSMLPVKLAGSHAGLATGEDGASHQALEDIALMRTLPGMIVACPADGVETKSLVLKSLELENPLYIRLCRLKTPVIFGDKYSFEFGKGSVVEDGADVSIIATGIMLSKAMEASTLLKKEGINARIINMATIKPLDEDIVLKAASETGAIVTAEDHSIVGGLGGAVCELLSEKKPSSVKRVGVRDRFGESAPPEQLFEKYGLTATAIASAAKSALAEKDVQK